MRQRLQPSYVVGRFVQAIGVLWAVATLTFFVLYAIPGDPAVLMLGGGISGAPLSDDQIQAVREQYGLDHSLGRQYVDFFWNAVHGDFGVSFRTKESVASAVGTAIGHTAELVLLATAIGVVLGVALGSAAAVVKRSWLRAALASLPPLLSSLPNFWVALVVMQLFSFKLRWFPATGDQGMRALIMPAVTLALPATAYIAQTISGSLRAALSEHYVEVARSRGATEGRVFFAHAFRNALLPAVTILGMVVAYLFAFSTIPETIFGRRGIGSLLQSSVSAKDIPMVLALVLVVAAAYVLLNLLVDLAYPFLDPRVGSGTGGRRRRVIRNAESAVRDELL